MALAAQSHLYDSDAHSAEDDRENDIGERADKGDEKRGDEFGIEGQIGNRVADTGEIPEQRAERSRSRHDRDEAHRERRARCVPVAPRQRDEEQDDVDPCSRAGRDKRRTFSSLRFWQSHRAHWWVPTLQSTAHLHSWAAMRVWGKCIQLQNQKQLRKSFSLWLQKVVL